MLRDIFFSPLSLSLSLAFYVRACLSAVLVFWGGGLWSLFFVGLMFLQMECIGDLIWIQIPIGSVCVRSCVLGASSWSI